MRKEPHWERATYTSPASITLREGNFAAGAVTLVTVSRDERIAWWRGVKAAA